MQSISAHWKIAGVWRWLTGWGANVAPRLMQHDPDLAMVWLPGRSRQLVLVFTGITRHKLHPKRLEFRAIASDGGHNHVIFINDRTSSWYSRPGLRDKIVQHLQDFVARHQIVRISSIGNSMGGYGAILFCRDLPISNVVAIVPQILMTDAVLSGPIWNKARPFILKGIVPDLVPIIAATASRINILYGDRDEDDRTHLSHLRRTVADAAHVSVVVVPGQNHKVAAWLKSRGFLGRIVGALQTGNRAELDDCSRALEHTFDLSLA